MNLMCSSQNLARLIPAVVAIKLRFFSYSRVFGVCKRICYLVCSSVSVCPYLKYLCIFLCVAFLGRLLQDLCVCVCGGFWKFCIVYISIFIMSISLIAGNLKFTLEIEISEYSARVLNQMLF